jgi:hypothetical protein
MSRSEAAEEAQRGANTSAFGPGAAARRASARYNSEEAVSGSLTRSQAEGKRGDGGRRPASRCLRGIVNERRSSPSFGTFSMLPFAGPVPGP